MQNATLKNNILFGRAYKKELYEKVYYVFLARVKVGMFESKIAIIAFTKMQRFSCNRKIAILGPICS